MKFNKHFIWLSVLLIINLVNASPYSYNINSGDQININTLIGNFTNLSQLNDVNIPFPNNYEILTYDNSIKKWISKSLGSISGLWTKIGNDIYYDPSGIGKVAINTSSFSDSSLTMGGDIDMEYHSLIDTKEIIFTNGDSITGNSSILFTIDNQDRLLLGQDDSIFSGDVRNVDNIDDWSRFSETNLNNGTMAIAGFTATNVDNDEIRMGITSRGYDSGNPLLPGGQGGIFLNSDKNMGFSIGYDQGFLWRNDPNNSGLHENTTNLLMRLDENGDLNLSGTLIAESLNLTNPSSINFLDVDNFIARLSATTLNLSGKTRNGIQSDKDFGIQTNYDGSSILANVNLNSSNISSSTLLLTNSQLNELGMIKTTSNHYLYNDTSFIYNDGIEFNLLNKNEGFLNFGFFDSINGFSDFSFNNFSNLYKVIEIANSTFNYLTKFNNAVFIDNDLNVSGNIIGNNIYGEMYYNSDSFNEITIPSKETWINITGLDSGLNNNITFLNYTLICEIEGTYIINHYESYQDGVGNEYNFAIAINDLISNKTRSHSLMTNANDIGHGSGGGNIYCNKDDVLTLQVSNQQTSSNVKFHQISVTMNRIGN